jgi:hypothetical protein
MSNRKVKHGSAAGDAENAQARPDDQYDEDLHRDNQRGAGGSTMADLAHPGGAGDATGPMSATAGRTDGGEFPQHDRKGQAQSPVEETPNQPERKREGHAGGARDS